ncbi:AMP deaminase [Plasmodium falciparum MaliPS096_E11]|uniref:AMP deaminase n=1 Tax=Plasmodium falciparum MaliPS096_E11 TaxID=1036727 RepID=A0A024WLZ5_PLAFA|nr:AMP deaminase [Plasmodium falciparum MaliPS096_E11]
MRLPNKNDGHKTVPQKEKGWNNLYETVVNISSKSSIKYDEYTLLNKDLNKLQTCNRFSFTLTSTGAVTKEQLEVSRKLIRLCNLRDTYIKKFQDIDTCLVESKSLNKNYKSKNIDDYESSEPIYNPYNVKILKNCNAFINFVDGIFFVHWDPHTDEGPSSRDMCVESNKLANHRNIKSAEDYLSSIQEIMNVVQDPACKSFCFQRLKYLEKKFDFHIMFNGPLELSETRDIKHRDFYNIRKVDVHVHHSACMQQKELLRFIREKYRTEPNTVVYINEKREMLTLKSIFDEELKSTAYESTIDTLGVNALGNCFHRFDLFNEKYNPFGQKLLRDIFLKTDNYIEGRYLAEITKKQIKNLERSKYQHVEWRISIYGKNKNEWLKISKWVLNNQLSSIRVRWMIQVPRLYHIYKKMKLINTFADFLSNIFSPCFEAIKNPEENKEIFIFLHQIVGWDSVDDESIISNYTLKGGELPTPDKYVSEHNPPYSYYAYYMYINIRMLNEFMISRNMRPMAFSIFDEELKSTAYESTIDTLGVNALGNCFHRFDLFNEKYNPFGQKLLRDIFLKTDNYIEGRYLAEITKKQIKNLERSKYQHVEWRISIYGKNKNEWLKISKWVLNNQLSSIRVRWMIQVPRLYHIYKKMKLINTFADFLSNIFSPCFEAIKNPEENKEIFIFLHQIVGWDSVDDESIISNYTLKGGELPTPDKYVSEHNPPYSYYAYYMYINIRMLNEFMISRNMRPMAFRPHCGEIGNMSHLACMFLLADRINHGINLRKSPVLLYLYYLKQIGLALSPLSNNALFLHIDKNPFKRFFKIGLNVTLSTDDPLMFHFTDEPLLEEYSICAHTWKLSTVDLCEIARASVIQSGYEPAFKKHWLGDEDGFFNFQNDPNKTNLSNTRMVYRRNTLEEEIKNIERLASYSSNN